MCMLQPGITGENILHAREHADTHDTHLQYCSPCNQDEYERLGSQYQLQHIWSHTVEGILTRWFLLFTCSRITSTGVTLAASAITAGLAVRNIMHTVSKLLQQCGRLAIRLSVGMCDESVTDLDQH